jgi:hypothetical protein
LKSLAPSGRARWKAAIAVGLLAVLLRLVVMLAPPADLFYGGQVWVEEWLRGNIAHEILAGPVVPLQDHQIPFWGGMLVVGILAVPCFAVFGPTLFALRLATLPFAFVLAGAGFLLVDRLAGRRAAWIAGILLALTPPGFTYASVLAQGTHCEQTAIGVLLLWLYAEHRLSGCKRLDLALIVGLVFGFHVSFGAALVLPLIVAFDFASDRRFFLRREFAVRALGMIVGAIPFLHHQLVYGGRPFENYGQGPVQMLTPTDLGSVAKKLLHLPFSDFPTSLWFGDTLGDRSAAILSSIALCVLFLVALSAHARSLGRFVRALLPWKPGDSTLDPLVLVLTWPFGWWVLYAMTPFTLGPGEWIIDYRYLLPLQIFLLVNAAIGLDVVAQRSRRLAKLAVPIACAFAVLMGYSAIARCDFAHASELYKTPGARPEGVAKRVLWKHGTDPPPLASFVEKTVARRTSDEQDGLFYELASSLRQFLAQQVRWQRSPTGESDDPRRALQWCAEHVPARCRAWFEVPASGPPPLLPADRAAFRPDGQ